MTREEAIKNIKLFFTGINIALSNKTKEALDVLIPELRESEDERTRKGLIEALKASKTVGELKFILPEPTREECIAYLEKQKEQKPVDNEKVEITDFEQSVYDLCPVLGIKEAKATASDLLELAKKELLKTGKVVLASNYPEGCSFEDGFHLGYNEGFNAKEEQKPAEWSEEDETKLRDVVRLVEDSGHVKSIREHYEKFLTSLPERFNLCPEQEWSEEDEDYMKDLMDYFGHNLPLEHTPHAVRDWLKSLRHSWRPSKEQIGLLGKVYNLIWADPGTPADVQDGLGDFIEQLKTL